MSLCLFDPFFILVPNLSLRDCLSLSRLRLRLDAETGSSSGALESIIFEWSPSLSVSSIKVPFYFPVAELLLSSSSL